MRRDKIRSDSVTKDGHYRNLGIPCVRCRRRARIVPVIRFRKESAAETRDEEYQGAQKAENGRQNMGLYKNLHNQSIRKGAGGFS